MNLQKQSTGEEGPASSIARLALLLGNNDTIASVNDDNFGIWKWNLEYKMGP